MASPPSWYEKLLKPILVGSDFRNIQRRLQSYTQIYESLLALGIFATILINKVAPFSYFPELSSVLHYQNLTRFLVEKGLMAILSCVLMYVFLNVRRSVRTELDVTSRLFSATRTPQQWNNVEGHKAAPLVILLHLLVFLAAAWFVDEPRVFCLVIAGYAILNIISMIIFRRNIKRYFSDQTFLPPAHDEHANFIMQRRAVAEDYLFGKWHIRKEVMLFTGAVIAAVLAFVPNLAHLKQGSQIPLLIMIVVMFTNEQIVSAWRRGRDPRLELIDERETQADALRMGE